MRRNDKVKRGMEFYENKLKVDLLLRYVPNRKNINVNDPHNNNFPINVVCWYE